MLSPEEVRPPWLIRMENGAIGEARARAFLLNRFWLLERSVDVDGADYIIQRRITGRNLLDPNPPKFGVVQVKFFKSPSTKHFVHREYVVDDKTGEPRAEFFLLAHTGTEDREQSYLLPASDIVDDFQIASENHTMAGRYALPGSLVLSPKYEILQQGFALDRIEAALKHADFRRNRLFLSWAMPGVSLQDDIAVLYKEPFDNHYGDIPEAFAKLKQEAMRGFEGIEEAYTDLRTIIETDDPEKALTLAEKYTRGNGRLQFPELWNDDLYYVVVEHKKRHASLKRDGLLDRFLILRQAVIERFTAELRDIAPDFPEDQAYIVCVTYNPTTFERPSTRLRTCAVTEIVRRHDLECSGVVSALPGEVEVYWIPANTAFRTFKDGQFVMEEWGVAVRRRAELPAMDAMDKIFEMRYET